MNARKSMQYIIEKVINAIAGIYYLHPSQNDKDLAYLILQFGGPALLDIYHRAINLPSTSTASGMIKDKTLNSSLDAGIKDIVENIVIDTSLPKYGHMLKVDETFVDQNAWWCPLDD